MPCSSRAPSGPGGSFTHVPSSPGGAVGRVVVLVVDDVEVEVLDDVVVVDEGRGPSAVVRVVGGRRLAATSVASVVIAVGPVAVVDDAPVSPAEPSN
ncbi:MAG: hypothetical protein LC792_21830 [Actinobacteria bacterium]|nr:hypothetical protein [Actinomycetota bacterium]